MGFLMVVVVVVVVVVVTLKQQKSAPQQGIPEVARWLLTTTTATTTKNAMLESLARQGFSCPDGSGSGDGSSVVAFRHVGVTTCQG